MGIKLLVSLALALALSGSVVGQEEPPGKHLAQGVLENETLGVTFRLGMTQEEIEAQPIETFGTSSTMGVVTEGRYGMPQTQLDSIRVFYEDGIANSFWITGEVDRDSVRGYTNDDEYDEYIKNVQTNSHWTVDGLSFDATREEIKAWYGAPTWEARGNLCYQYREDGSFVDAMTNIMMDELMGNSCLGVDDGTVFSVTFYFWDSDNMSWIDVAGEVPQALE